jgi:cell division septation protein DedD
VIIIAFITAFALGLAFFYYNGLAERVPAAAAPPPIAETPAPIAESPASKAESPAPESEAKAPPAAAGAAKPEVQPPATAEASTAIPQTPAATPSTQAGFVVQVGAYEERSKSEELARRVSTFYQGAVVVAPAQVRGKTYYRVQLPVGTREEAKQLAARLAKEQKIEAWVRPLP